MSRNDSKYFSTTKKGEIPELKEELNSQYKVFHSPDPFTFFPFCSRFFFLHSIFDPSPDPSLAMFDSFPFQLQISQNSPIRKQLLNDSQCSDLFNVGRDFNFSSLHLCFKFSAELKIFTMMGGIHLLTYGAFCYLHVFVYEFYC